LFPARICEATHSKYQTSTGWSFFLTWSHPFWGPIMFDTAPGSVTTVEAAAIFGHWSTSSSVPLSSDLCNGAKRCNERSPFAMFKEFSLACLRKSGALPSLRRCQPSNHSPGHIWVGPRMGDIDHKTVLSFKWLVRNNLILLRVKS
jgi:hypothetical protein